MPDPEERPDGSARDLVPAATAADEVARLAAQAARYADEALSASTRRAYESQWRRFVAWCEARGAVALPASGDVVMLYLADRAAGASVSTLTQIQAAIRAVHLHHDLPPPSSGRLDRAAAGMRRDRARAPRQVRPLTLRDLKRVVSRLPTDLTGVRDRALLLVGFAGALRRSELVALDLAGSARSDSICTLAFVAGGLRIWLGRSKTDQDGDGQLIAIPFGRTRLCPVAALRAWLDLAAISSGPIFRPISRHGRLEARRLRPEAVAEIVKRAAERADLDPALFSGHSLRAGFVTTAAEADVATELIMKQTRHRKAETVAIYVREADAFRRNAAGKVGL